MTLLDALDWPLVPVVGLWLVGAGLGFDVGGLADLGGDVEGDGVVGLELALDGVGLDDALAVAAAAEALVVGIGVTVM